MNFPSLTGTKEISTASQYDRVSEDGYLAILWITAFDSEGKKTLEDFIIALLIQPSLELDLILILVLIGIVVAIGLVIGILLFLRKKKRARLPTPAEGYYEHYYGDDSHQESFEHTQVKVHYCPYCGYQLTSLRNFCPSCGKSLKFQEQ